MFIGQHRSPRRVPLHAVQRAGNEGPVTADDRPRQGPTVVREVAKGDVRAQAGLFGDHGVHGQRPARAQRQMATCE